MGQLAPEPDAPTSDFAWVEDAITRLMKRHDISAAGVTVVAAGEVGLERAFGTMARDTDAPVNVETSRFRVASVGKVFTALAALQLVEKGRLDLHQDLRESVTNFPVRSDGRGPVTLAQLLTHSGGFDERIIGYAYLPSTSAEGLSEYLARRMPPRTSAPELVPSYSNHGYALVGLAVESVTGVQFDEYARSHIFEPLGMEHTLFLRGPLPADVEASLVREYWSDGSSAVYALSRPYPAGSLATTVRDMGRFLKAFSGALRGDTTPTMPESAVASMTKSQFSGHPDLPGYTFGFGETTVEGERVILKGGAGAAHAAIIAFFPNRDVGFFVAGNRHELRFVEDFLHEFGKHIVNPSADLRALEATPGNLDRFAGEYRLTRMSHRSAEKLLSLATTLNVQIAGDRISLASPLEDFNDSWRPKSETAFVAPSGRQIAFRQNVDADPTHVVMTIAGDQFAFERLSPLQTPSTILSAVGLCLMLPLLTLLGVACGAVTRLLRKRDRPAQSMRAVWISFATCAVVNLAVAGSLVAALSGWEDLIYGPTTPLLLAGGLSIGSLAMTLLVTTLTTIAAARRRLTVGTALASAVGLTGVIGFAVFLVSFHVVGFQF